MDWVSIETGNSAEYSSVAWAYDEGDDSSVKRPLVIQVR